jgi:hypothetical protein
VLRTLALSLFSLAVVHTAAAQEIFVAPNANSVFASTEQGFGNEGAHQLIVTNRSTVPIIVFGVTLYQCENVKQSCGGRPTKIAIGAGQRRDVGRAEAKDPEKGFGYRWRFAYRADSSDAKAIAALREHGIDVDGGRVILRPPQPDPVAPSMAMADAAPTAESAAASADTLPPRRIVYTSPEAEARIRAMAEERSRPARTLRFKLGYGSILGWTMMPAGTPVKPTGPCVDPAEAAKYEHDASIARTPWRPPVVSPVTPLVVADGLRDSTKIGDLLVRFVVDTAGTVIPESVTVLESPHGQLSVKACTAVMSTDAKSARDKSGRAIRAWVQMPVIVNRD